MLGGRAAHRAKGLYRPGNLGMRAGPKSGGGGAPPLDSEVGDDGVPLTRGTGASAARARAAGGARMAATGAAGRGHWGGLRPGLEHGASWAGSAGSPRGERGGRSWARERGAGPKRKKTFFFLFKKKF